MIETVPEVYQVRAESEHHIEELRRAIEEYGEVDPITVLPVGDRVIVIDGHHRLAAYQASGTEAVKVRWFEGSPTQARTVAASSNSRAKLNMTAQERFDCAWGSCLLGRFSKRVIAKSSGVSERSVAYMRQAMGILGDRASEYGQWWQAREEAFGRPERPDQDNIDEWKHEQAMDFADRMTRAFSTKLAKSDPEIAAMALAAYFGRKLPGIAVALRNHIDDDTWAEAKRDWEGDDEFGLGEQDYNEECDF